MTVTTPMEDLTAPRHPEDPHAPTARIVDHGDHPPGTGDDTPIEDFAAQATAEGPRFTPSRRADGWTPDRQRAFLEYIAQGLTVGDAAAAVGLSATSAYAFRARMAGAAFAVGWQGALLLQRNRLVDELTARAFRGQSETLVRPDGTRVERHRYDNRLALALLTRLDKIAAAELPDRTGDARAARLAAQDWERYLDLIGGDGSAAQAGLFLALRVTEGAAAGIDPITTLARADLYRRTGASHVSEIDVADLDPAHRGDWSAEQWIRAEAAGLVALAPDPADEEEDEEDKEDGAEDEDARRNAQLSQRRRDRAAAEAADLEAYCFPQRGPHDVWWSHHDEKWRTRYPPPDDFDGFQDRAFGETDYQRDLTADERYAMDAPERRETERRRPIEAAARDAYFAAQLVAEVTPDAAEDGDDAQGIAVNLV